MTTEVIKVIENDEGLTTSVVVEHKDDDGNIIGYTNVIVLAD